MCSLGKALEKDHMEEEKNRLYKEQGVRTLEEEYKTTKEDKG